MPGDPDMVKQRDADSAKSFREMGKRSGLAHGGAEEKSVDAEELKKQAELEKPDEG